MMAKRNSHSHSGKQKCFPDFLHNGIAGMPETLVNAKKVLSPDVVDDYVKSTVTYVDRRWINQPRNIYNCKK